MPKQKPTSTEAAACYRQAIALRPGPRRSCTTTWASSARSRIDSTRRRQRYEHAIASRPDYAEAHNNLGNALKQQDKIDQAVAQFELALAFRSGLADAHNNLGSVLLGQGKLDEAEKRYEQAVALRPDYAEAYNNLGIIRTRQGRLDEAVAYCQKAIALRPDYIDAQLGMATCYLAQGDFERGWPAYEVRLRRPGRVPQTIIPRWTGESLVNRSLLLLAEQGLGDTLQFVRYARALKERGARVIFGCPATLGRLLASDRDVDELFILGSTKELPSADFYLPLLKALARVPYGRLDDSLRCSLSMGRSRIGGSMASGTGGNRRIQDRHRLARPRGFHSIIGQ